MSNQAHKNRTSPKRFNYPPAGLPKGMVNQGIINREAFYEKRSKRMADFEARQAEKDPKKNPSGSAKFKGDAQYVDIGLGFGLGGKEVKALPSSPHSARLRGASDRKARGTQSSATRVPVK